MVSATNAPTAGVRLASRSLRANFSWSFAGNAVYAGCQWGMLIALAKLGTPEMVGQFALGLALSAPVMMFANLQLRGVQATDTEHRYRFRDYLALRLTTTPLALLFIVAITLMQHYRPDTAWVILAVSLSKAVESISDVYHGLFQQQERMDRIALSIMAKGLLSLAVMAGLVGLTGQVLWGAIGLAVVWGLVLVLYDIPTGTAILRGCDGPSGAASPLPATRPLGGRVQTLARLAWLALPLACVMLLISLNVNIPRYFVERYLGRHELGIFAATSYIMVAGNTLVAALGQSASPRLAHYYASGNVPGFCALLRRLLALGVLLGSVAAVLALVAGEKILTLLYTAEYARHAGVFTLLMVAAGIGYVSSFLGYGMTAARYFRAQLPLFAAVTAASVGACFWLIPSQGLQGAGIAILIAMVVQFIGGAAILGYALRRRACR